MIKDTIYPIRMRNLIQGRNEDKILSYVDLWAIEDDVAIGVSGSATMGFEIRGRNILLKNDAQINAFYLGIADLLDSLPSRGRLDLQLSYEVEPGSPEILLAHQESFTTEDPLARKITDERIALLQKRGIRHTRIYLFFTLQPEDQGLVVHFRSGKPPREAFESEHKAKVKALSEVEGIAKLALEGIGIPNRRLSGYELALYFYKALNPNRSRLIPVPFSVKASAKIAAQKDGYFSLSGPWTARSALLFSRAWVENQYVTLDGIHHAVVNLHQKPDAVDEWSMKLFLDHLPFDYRLMLTIRTTDEEKVMGRQKIDANFNRNLFEYSPFKNYEAKQKYAELDGFLEEASSTNERPYQFSLSVLLCDTDPEALKEKIKETLLAYRQLGEAEAVSEDFDHFPLFFSHLPGHTRRNFRGDHLILTRALSYFFPTFQEWDGSPNAPTILTTRRHELLKFDFWNDENPANHGLVVGSTGGGKSFAVNYLIKDFLLSDPRNHHVIVIDVGFSYRKMAKAFGGKYYEIDLSGKYSLNPFPEKAYLERGKEIDFELLTYLSELLGKMVTDSESENLSGADVQLLEHVILEVYREIGPKDAPRLSDVRRVLLAAGKGEVLDFDDEDKKKAVHYGKNLALYTEGLYSKVLDQPGKLAIDSPLLVFNLLKLADHPKLQSVISFIIQSLVHAKLVDVGLKKLIVFDETHMLMSDPASVKLIRMLYRIARKYNTCVYSISQSPNEFLQCAASDAMITNAHVRWMLPLNEGHESLSHFHLADHEIEAVRHLQMVKGHFSECFIKSGEEGVVARLWPSPLEYWLCTTNAEDWLCEKKVRAEHPNWETGEVLEYLAKHFPNGATGGTHQ